MKVENNNLIYIYECISFVKGGWIYKDTFHFNNISKIGKIVIID
mgnify:CR=1 FL=1